MAVNSMATDGIAGNEGSPESPLSENPLSVDADPSAHPASAEPVEDASGIAQLDAQGFLLDPSHPDSGLVGTSINGLPIWSAQQTAAHIGRAYGTWADYTSDLEVTFSFHANWLSASGEPFDALNQQWARYAFDLYAQISGLTFREVGAEERPDIAVQFEIGSTNGGGWANYPSASGGIVNIGHVSWEPEITPGTGNFHTVVHEIGHALGLAHPGDYNGGGNSYANDADYYNDTNQYTNMSYWSESHTGGSFGRQTTPLLHDILAIQMEYGANWETRAGNDVYGYNNTTGEVVYDLSYTGARDVAVADVAFTIWDGGGIDRLDFSGSIEATVLDLREASFSSVNGQTYNVSIAYGVDVEEAVGSGRADKIRGNNLDNRIEGGEGDDFIVAGDAVLPIASGEPTFTGVLLNADPLVRDQYLSAAGVDAFSGQGFTLEMMVELLRIPSNGLVFASYASSRSRNDVLIEGDRDGTLAVTIANVSFATTILTESLVDGHAHRLSVAWDKASGALNIYVDGELVQSATHQAGATIGSGGTLVFGQEQDSIGGGFDNRQVLPGAIGDIRVFEAPRSGGDIANTAFTELNGGETGLVHYWPVAASDAGSIADAAGARALTVHNGAAPNNTAPAGSAITDRDIVYGGTGRDEIHGGIGNDQLYGDGSGLRTGGSLALVELNSGYADQSAAYDDHSLDQTANFTMPATAVTVEMVLKLDQATTAFDTLFAYADGGEWSTQHFTLRPNGYGRWALTVAGEAWDTGLDGRAFTADEPFRLSVTWDSETGSAAIYIDGREIASGVVAQGASLPANGDFWLFSGWDGTLHGSIGDIRVWDRARAAEEISADAWIAYDSPAGRNGLVANWQADGVTATLTDLVGRAGTAPLVVQNVTGSNPLRFETTNFADRFNDTLDGGLGADFLSGGAGRDELDGGDGFDWIVGGAGADAIIGGAGTDTAAYGTSNGGVTVNLAAGTGRWNDAEGDTFNGVENIYGSRYGDTLFGDASSNRLSGGGGYDWIVGGAGADAIIGGGGTDTAAYGTSTGGVTVDLAAGTGRWSDAEGDTYQSIENVYGSRFTDSLIGDAGNNQLSGGGGGDWIVGGGGADTLNGGAGADIFVFGARFGNDVIGDWSDSGGGNDDTLWFNSGTITSMSDVSISYAGGSATITTAEGSISLTGVSGNLDETDFNFQ